MSYEQKIIGGIVSGLIVPSGVDLASTDFENADLGRCLEIARELELENKPINAEVLISRLSEQDFYNVNDFNLMAQSCGSVSMALEAVDRVKGKALKSFLLQQTASLAIADKKTGTQILDNLRDLVTHAEQYYQTSDNNFVFLKDLVGQVKGVYTDLHAGTSYAVSTGFPEIDEHIVDGFSKGDLHVIVGFTGQGKSALALNCAKFQAKQNICVGVLSREMSAIENVMRLQSAETGTARWKIRKNLYIDDFYKLTDNLDEIAKLPIAFDTRTKDIESLRPQVRKMVEQYDMQILYVDYLQLLSSSKNSTRAEEVAAVSRGLKEIAMENKIPVVALCQYNRAAANASVFDLINFLKESSGIEQDSSTIVYIQIEKTEEKKQIKDAKLTVLKNRNGATFASVDLRYHGEIFTFYEARDISNVSSVTAGGAF